MARLITTGFELRNNVVVTGVSPDGGIGSSSSFELSIVRSGAASVKTVGSAGGTSAGASGGFTATALGNDLFLRAYVYVPTGGLPAGGAGVMGLAVGGQTTFALVLETDGTLTLWAVIAATWIQQGSASAAITLDAWNRIELRARIGTGSVDQCEGRLEGTSFASTSGLNVSDTQPASWLAGLDEGTPQLTPTTTSCIVYVDDVALNDSTGAAQNSWPGDSKIVLLRPTADSAVGTGWTLGNTTATGGNAWSRLDDAPPNSATDLTTTADADQIRNATSNANVNYDATMTTYTAAGIGASDTVNVVVPIIATGAPVVTSAKAGTVGVVSNPAIANIALGAGGTSGAFWSGVATGTYPTGNKWSFGTTTYAPTVTLGTAPVMRVTQVTASTRIAIVTEMGIYVDYTPAVVIAPTPLVHQSVPFYPGPSRPS